MSWRIGLSQLQGIIRECHDEATRTELKAWEERWLNQCAIPAKDSQLFGLFGVYADVATCHGSDGTAMQMATLTLLVDGETLPKRKRQAKEEPVAEATP